MDERLAELRRQMLEVDREESFALFLEWILVQRREVKLTFFVKWAEAETRRPRVFQKAHLPGGERLGDPVLHPAGHLEDGGALRGCLHEEL